MKFQYNLQEITRALTYNDLKGLIKLIQPTIFEKGELPVSDMEEIFMELFLQLENLEDKKYIENLMLSCARVNSIGY